MNARRATNDRLTYVYLALLNICVIGMFLVVLTPTPSIAHPVSASVGVGHSALRAKASRIQPTIGTPIHVMVPSVGIDTPVRTGSYDIDSSSWTIDHHSAFYADITVPANNINGTTLIYGHAGWGIFNTLPNVTDGAVAYVDTAEGYRFMYVFESKHRVDPSDVSVLNSTGPPQLVLQTCSGAFDAYRTLVTFRFNGVVRNE